MSCGYRFGLKAHLAAMVKRLKNAKLPVFEAQAFLDSAGVAREVREFKRAEVVYSQGDLAEGLMYLQGGGVKLTVVHAVGKEAVVAILGPGDFSREGSLAGQTVRMGTATTVSPSAVLVIEKGEMFKALHEQHALSDRFIRFMLARSVRIEADRTDPLFNSGEKRLACTLLLFARYGKEDGPHGMLPKLTQEMLADMIGTTRSRVNFFINKFRKLGFIEYSCGLPINTSLLSVVPHE
jgi:CRP/FNR family cyclic AMP-dependent transcriptional regulator